MSDQEQQESLARLVREIRDAVRAQGERQERVLAIQEELLRMSREQTERATRLQDRAEALQDRGAKLVGGIRMIMPVVVAIVIVLIGYVTWLLVRLGALR